jgi:hypothetical protein
VANRSKVTLLLAVLATGFFLVSGAATCQANDTGRTVFVEAVQADSDIGSAPDANTTDRSNNDIGSAQDDQDSDKGDIGIGR